MRVLLLRPVPGNERFGLGPFFRIEPLGMEYLASGLEARGHEVTLVDLRFGRPVDHYLSTVRPALVGVACMHALEIEDTLKLVRRVKQATPGAFVLVGGHSASAYPSPFLTPDVDAVCRDDGERVIPELVECLERGASPGEVRGLVVPDRNGQWTETTSAGGDGFDLDRVPLPSRSHVEPWRRQYACLQYRPVWLVETARGCPFRCSFCSVWPLYRRAVRERSVDAVCRDFAQVGPNVFVADDLFWHHPARSRELALELRRRGIRKNWLLVQSRVDLVASQPDLLEVWRPVACNFDIFFGLEAATNEGLSDLAKDTTVDRTVEAIGVARQLGYMVTGNFVIDPAWEQSDFETLWDFVERHGLSRAGYTVLTPLPGTPFFEETRERIRARDWSQFDMHHVLWEPRLGAPRFFELYCETWRRSILNLRGEKSLWRWARQARLGDLWFLARMLGRTQRLMDPSSYLVEHRLAESSWAPSLPERSAPVARA